VSETPQHHRPNRAQPDYRDAVVRGAVAGIVRAPRLPKRQAARWHVSGPGEVA
jgi:hypothetical protein